ncbi:hypothetical protein [Agrobacterium tumefaciens]|uniref:hypothetical protein n=1 Tax=Agrobacterium tumefaciens TaxID=358 RepID=UPI003BA201BD
MSDRLEGLIAEFRARLARANVNRSAINVTALHALAIVTEKLIPRDTYQITDAKAAQMRDELNKLDRGRMNKAEYAGALSKVFQVSVASSRGHSGHHVRQTQV